MQWTKQKPTEDGTYLCRYKIGEGMIDVKMNHAFVPGCDPPTGLFGGRWILLSDSFFEDYTWLGPVNIDDFLK